MILQAKRPSYKVCSGLNLSITVFHLYAIYTGNKKNINNKILII